MVRRFIINVNNFFTRLRRIKAKAENILLLLPHCLQKPDCEQNIVNRIDSCKRCGGCNVGPILELRDKYGVQCELVSGGRQAIEAVRRKNVRVVIAVACEKELTDGILAAVPRPVIALCNRRPHGPCRFTQVDALRIRDAIESCLDRA